MPERPRWILDFDPDFPATELIARAVPDAVVVERSLAGVRPWPGVKPPFVGYGTMRTMTRMRREPRLAAAVFDDYALLRCSSYYRAVYDLLGRAAFVVPLTALHSLDLARFFGDRVFVRPDSNFKLFASQILPTREAPAFAAAHAEHRDELVVLAEVVDLGREYRCFCRDAKVFCHSSYPREPYEPAPPEVRAFAEQAAERLRDALGLTMVTVDVALGADRMRVVEVGGVNSWGIYGGSVADFVAAMEAEAIRRFDDEQGG